MSTSGEWHDSVRKEIWPLVKNSSRAASSRGWLAESWVAELLDKNGCPFIRGWEKAPIDGAFARDAPPDFASKSPLEKLFAYDEGRIHNFLSMDIKYFEFIKDRHGRDYPFRGNEEIGLRNVEVYFVVFQDVEDYIAIVPKMTFHAFAEISQGVHPLILKSMAWNAPFMVHLEDLRKAVDNLLAVVDGQPYVNPTNHVTLTGWVPRVEHEVSLYPTNENDVISTNSLAAIKQLMKDILALSPITKVSAHMNVVQPLIADFLLSVPGILEHIRIEHKFSSREELSSWTFRNDNTFPWAKTRLWHFLIAQRGFGKNAQFWCIGRDRVMSEWQDMFTLPVKDVTEKFQHFSGPEAILHMVQYITKAAPKAVEAAVQASAEITGSDVLPASEHELNSKGSDDELESDNHAESNPPDDRDTGDAKSHATGLPWLVTEINEQAYEDKELFVTPLDLGHAICNHLAIRCKWTADEAEMAIDQHLPRQIYDRELCAKNVDCLPLRFVDFSGGDKNAWAQTGLQFSPLAMRCAYWQKPAGEQQFLNVFSALEDDDARIFDAYGLLPSGHTTQFSSGERRESLQSDAARDQEEYQTAETTYARSEARCRDYFLFKANNSADIILSQPSKLRGSARFPIRKGGDYTKPGIDPLKNFVQHRKGDIYTHIRELLCTDDPPDMTIQGSQKLESNPPIIKADYRAKIRDILQAYWDFGLLRKPRRNEN